MTYPKLNQIQVEQEEIPTYIQEIPEEPDKEQMKMFKPKIIAEIQDVFSDE